MKRWIKPFLEVFDDWLTRSAGIVFVLIVAIVIFNMKSTLAETHAFLAVAIYGMVPVLFIVGGIIFIMAILKFSRQGSKDGTV